MATLFWDKNTKDKITNEMNHGYPNKLVSHITENDIFDEYITYHGKKGFTIYNEGVNDNLKLPECFINPLPMRDFGIDVDKKSKRYLYKLSVYVKEDEKNITTCVIVRLNEEILFELLASGRLKKIESYNKLRQLCINNWQYFKWANMNYNANFYNSLSTATNIKNNIDFLQKEVMEPVDYSFDEPCLNIHSNKLQSVLGKQTEQVNDFHQLNLNLYQYQKCSINWMIQKERVKNHVEFNVNKDYILGNVYFDPKNNDFFPLSQRPRITFNGGAIIDEVGLGKTLEMIGLHLSNSEKNSVKFTNKFTSNATLVICPNQLCKQWVREIEGRLKKEHALKTICILTKRDFDKLTYNDLIEADFVVVSYTFLGNTCFTTHTTTPLGFNKSFCGSKRWDNITHARVAELYDNMGKELMKNTKVSLGKVHALFQLIHWNRIVVDEFHETMNSAYIYVYNILRYITSNYKWCVTATPFTDENGLLHIVDFLTNYQNSFGNEIFLSENIIDYVHSHCFRRNTKLSVKTEHTLPPIEEEIRFLRFSQIERTMYNAHLMNHNNNIADVYLRQLCCHPQLSEENKYILAGCKSLADIEKAMLSSYKNKVDIEQQKVNVIKLRIRKLETKIRRLERKKRNIENKKRGLALEPDSDDEVDTDFDEDDDIITINAQVQGSAQQHSITIDRMKNKIKEIENGVLRNALNELDGKTKTYTFFSNVVDRIRKRFKRNDKKESINETEEVEYEYIEEEIELEEDEEYELVEEEIIEEVEELVQSQVVKEEKNDDENEDVCGICLNELNDENIGVTECGHMFCYDCLTASVQRYHNCPYCKKSLSPSQLCHLSYESPLVSNNPGLSKLINQVGTKLAHLITYIKSRDVHTIIFSQWDDLLRKVGSVLKEHGIENIFCKGNCYQRDKAISEFNKTDSKIKVIMLSSDSTASGTNLTKAKEIIFIDPMYGTYERRRGQERQAIGRAHRTGQTSTIKVTRFIVKDTIEHDIYKENIIEDAKHKSDFEKQTEMQID